MLTEVNGRPVFVAQSTFAFYRDMGWGDSGPDVEALQRMLASRGYDVVADGSYGAETATAVSALYRDSGYVAPLRKRADASGASVEPSATQGASSDPAAEPVTEAFLPLAEIVTMPFGKATVLQGIALGAHAGSSSGADLVLGSTDVIVTVSGSPAETSGLTTGARATVTLSGAEVEATIGPMEPIPVSSGATNTGGTTDTASSPKVQFVVTPVSPWEGGTSEPTARVTVDTIVAENALLVPVIAVVERGSDDFVVVVEGNDGELDEVPVVVVTSLDGEAAVQPVIAGTLAAGGKVRVG
ncbi:peptidoglycan-binding protein [Microbacterium sp. ZW T5_56]|uniref:peptidoglycan-binding protein n=1 Tax=Microbacterium sp. ZW T5_56 TaxID=3378081 RepID=UPI00385417BD